MNTHQKPKFKFNIREKIKICLYSAERNQTFVIKKVERFQKPVLILKIATKKQYNIRQRIQKKTFFRSKKPERIRLLKKTSQI